MWRFCNCPLLISRSQWWTERHIACLSFNLKVWFVLISSVLACSLLFWPDLTNIMMWFIISTWFEIVNTNGPPNVSNIGWTNVHPFWIVILRVLWIRYEHLLSSVMLCYLSYKTCDHLSFSIHSFILNLFFWTNSPSSFRRESQSSQSRQDLWAVGNKNRLWLWHNLSGIRIPSGTECVQQLQRL
jgi:hypothetical protein